MDHRPHPDEEISNHPIDALALAEEITKKLCECRDTVPGQTVNSKNNHVISEFIKKAYSEQVHETGQPDREEKPMGTRPASSPAQPVETRPVPSPAKPVDTRLHSYPKIVQSPVTIRSDHDLIWLDEPQTLYLPRKLYITDSLSFVGNLARVLSSSCVMDAMKKVKLLTDLIATADAVAYPVFAIDRAGRVIAWNKAMAGITGVPAQEILGKGDHAYSVPFYGTPRPMQIDRLLHNHSPAKTRKKTPENGNGDVFTSEMEMVRIQGKPKLIWGKGTRIYDEDGAIIAVVQSIGIKDPQPPATISRAKLGTEGNGSQKKPAVPPLTTTPVSIVQPGRSVWDHYKDDVSLRAGLNQEQLSTAQFVQKKHEDMQSAFGLLVAKENDLFRHYNELSEEPRQLLESERNARTSEAFLKHVIMDAHEGIIAYDADLKCILWNTFMENLTGIPRSEVLGKQSFDMFPALRDAGAYLLLEQALSGRTVESSDISFHIPMSGKQAWVRLIFSTLCDSDRKIMGIIGIVQDITAKKVMEYALQTTIIQLMESEEKYRNVFNAKNDPLLLIDTASRRIMDLNDATLQLYGYTRDEILAIPSSELFTEPEKYEDLLVQQTPGVRIFHQKKKDKTVFPADVSSAFFKLKDRSALILSIRDLSSVHQIADALKLANTKLNLMIGITRHDVINNLTVLMMYNDLLKCNLTDPRLLDMLEKQEKALHTIHREIEFTREYYDLGVKSSCWQNVCTTAMQAYCPFMSSVSFSCETDDLEINADPLLEKVFYNLFDNAVRYGEGITRIRMYYVRKGNDLVLIFGDDGVGIPAENKERIFTRGFGKNTGLGLFLSREILAITRIEIAETGEYEKGARFEFRIAEGLYRFTGSATTITGTASQKLDYPA